MSDDLNAFGEALELAKSAKYAKNKAVQAVLESVLYSVRSLDFDQETQEKKVSSAVSHNNPGVATPLFGFHKGIRGQYGYSKYLRADDVLLELKTPLTKALELKALSAKLECLINVLNAFGEKIEY